MDRSSEENKRTIRESDLLNALHTLEHEGRQLTCGLEWLWYTYFSNVKMFKNLSESKLKEIAFDLKGYLRQIDFLFREISILHNNPPEPYKERFSPYPSLLSAWTDTFRLEVKHRCVQFEVAKPKRGDSIHSIIYGDPTLLEQLMYILVSNAIKYCHRGTKIRLDCKKASSEKKSPHILIVTDYGIEFKGDKPFQPFNRGENVIGIEGLGLGLYSAYRIANVHNATLSYKCSKISNFNVPLIEPYLKSRFIGRDISQLDLLKEELERLQESNFYDKIVARNKQGIPLYQAIDNELAYEIIKPTWEVTFEVSIPEMQGVE